MSLFKINSFYSLVACCFLILIKPVIKHHAVIFEPRHEKTGFLHMLKQRGRSAAQLHRFSHDTANAQSRFSCDPSTAGILKTDLWPVQTDLEIFRPIYFASNVILSVR